nr:hypothetical protein [Corynebacterium lactis]
MSHDSVTPSSGTSGSGIFGRTNSVELTFDTSAALKNLGVLAHKALAIDDGALMRFRTRDIEAPGQESTTVLSQVWVKTPFGPLATRTLPLTANPDDVIVSASDVKEIAVRAFAQAKSSDDAEADQAPVTALPYRIPAQSSAGWPGFLPVLDGWEVVDYVPATAFRTLEKQARAVATESSGPLGLPTSLLDQKVLSVTGAGVGAVAGAGAAAAQASASEVDVTMRDVFALCSMGFIPESPDEREPVRVSAKGRWHRLDGRFGSVFTMESFGVLPIVG